MGRGSGPVRRCESPAIHGFPLNPDEVFATHIERADDPTPCFRPFACEGPSPPYLVVHEKFMNWPEPNGNTRTVASGVRPAAMARPECLTSSAPTPLQSHWKGKVHS